MRNIKATIEYDGTNYHGFQKQVDIPTIQDTLESCLMRVLKRKLKCKVLVELMLESMPWDR